MDRWAEWLLKRRFGGEEPPDAAAGLAEVRDHPMLDFDERDLLELAQDAGFLPVRLELDAEVVPRPPMSWDVFSSMAGNPKIPTPAEAMEEALSPAERERLTNHLRPLVERGGGVSHMARAYRMGTKPPE